MLIITRLADFRGQGESRDPTRHLCISPEETLIVVEGWRVVRTRTPFEDRNAVICLGAWKKDRKQGWLQGFGSGAVSTRNPPQKPSTNAKEEWWILPQTAHFSTPRQRWKHALQCPLRQRQIGTQENHNFFWAGVLREMPQRKFIMGAGGRAHDVMGSILSDIIITIVILANTS